MSEDERLMKMKAITEAALDRKARGREVAHHVQELVSHEFIAEPEAAVVENGVVVDDDAVVERAALGKPHGEQGFHILHEAEGARPRNLTAESLRLHI